MKEKLTALLKENFSEIDFTESDALVDDGILESMTVATIALELGITIPYEEVIPQNFNSLDAMAAMLERLEEA